MDMEWLCWFKHNYKEFDNPNDLCIYPRKKCDRCGQIIIYQGPMYGWIKR